jgi:hypothetical protein
MSMNKDLFKKILEEGSSGNATIGDRFSWVGLIAQLESRETPFTVKMIATETKQKRNYVYSHLRSAVEDGKLVAVKTGNGNYFLGKKVLEAAD